MFLNSEMASEKKKKKTDRRTWRLSVIVKDIPEGGGGTQRSFIQGGSAWRSNPLASYVPSYDKWYPFNIPSLERCIHFYSCKCTVS